MIISVVDEITKRGQVCKTRTREWIVRVVSYCEACRQQRGRAASHTHTYCFHDVPVPSAAVSSGFQQGTSTAQTRETLGLRWWWMKMIKPRDKTETGLLWYSFHKNQSSGRDEPPQFSWALSLQESQRISASLNPLFTSEGPEKDLCLCS